MEFPVTLMREDIMNFPFPYKLWIIVNLEFCDFFRWNRDGTIALLDLVGLDDYLSSLSSIFKIKNRFVFLQHLSDFQFERLNVNPEEEEDILLQYKHENFQRHRLDLLAKIRRPHTTPLLEESETPNSVKGVSKEFQSYNVRAADRMLGDLCFMFHGGLSNIQKSRLRFQTIFNFQNTKRMLREKIQASDEKVARSKRDDDQVIEIPAELFENPHDSVLNLSEDFRPEYAGYYGNCSKETITNFFGEYLPMYEDGTMEIRKISADHSANNNPLHTVGEHQDFLPTFSIDIDPNGIVSSTSSEFSNLPDLHFSASLEPIFKTDNEQDDPLYQINNNLVNTAEIIPKHIDVEDEITMEEFITFKDPLRFTPPTDSFENVSEDFNNIIEVVEESNGMYSLADNGGESYPHMPADVKLEIQDDQTVENEANFRTFFSQYRASLNLLYDGP